MTGQEYLEIMQDEKLERSPMVRVFEKQARIFQDAENRSMASGDILQAKKWAILALESKWWAIETAQAEKAQGWEFEAVART